jgi:hypothetical protein
MDNFKWKDRLAPGSLLLAPCPPLAPPEDYPSPMQMTPFTLRQLVFIVVAQPTQATSVYMLLVYALVA